MSCVELTLSGERAKRYRLPKWATKSFYQDGILYIPAVQAEVLSAMHDGEPSINVDGHVYLSIDWFIREYPANADKYRKMKETLIHEATRPDFVPGHEVQL